MSLGRRKVSVSEQSAWVFNKMAGVYGARPAYPSALVEAIACTVRAGARVGDIGAGIGHLSVPLAARGFEVIAVEPAIAMLQELQARAVAHGLAIRSVLAAAENLPLQSESLDLVVISDALHFMDKELASAEVARVLGRPGVLAVVTSEFGDTLFMRAVSEVMRDSAPRRTRAVQPAVAQLSAIVRAPFGEVLRFEDETPVSHAELDDILRSISFIGPAMNPERFAAFRARVHALDDRPVWARSFTLYLGHRRR